MIAYVVGGGPSAAEFDWDLAERGIVVACHAAAERLPFAPTFQLSVDRPFWEQNAPRPGSIGVWVRLGPEKGSRVHPDVARIDCVTGEDHWGKRWGESLAEGVMVGGCSGVAAMNLAYCLGAEEIHLVGIDLFGPETRPWGLWQDAFRFAVTCCFEQGVAVKFHGRWRP